MLRSVILSGNKYMLFNVYDRLGEMSVLHGFLEAKLWTVERERDYWLSMCVGWPNEYTRSKYAYAKNQVAVVKQLIRDAANPERTLKLWLKAIDKASENTETANSAKYA